VLGSLEPDQDREIRPYADHRDDGLVQVSFTLPVRFGRGARMAALEIARNMGLSRPEVVHAQEVTDGYTYLIIYGRVEQAVDYEAIRGQSLDAEYMSEGEVEDFCARHLDGPIVVVGASTGSDTHSLGIDAMLNMKGFDGDHGLEAYRSFATHNLGSQIPNAVLVRRAQELEANAIIVSQTVTQQDLHLRNLTELVEMVEAEGIRGDLTLVCGGPRISDELAKELGYDAGFSKGTLPSHLATFLVQAVRERVGSRGKGR
jgi:beta-lysine 5,6-aminomutase beta subunit